MLEFYKVTTKIYVKESTLILLTVEDIETVDNINVVLMKETDNLFGTEYGYEYGKLVVYLSKSKPVFKSSMHTALTNVIVNFIKMNKRDDVIGKILGE